MYMRVDGYPGMGAKAYGDWLMLLDAQRGIVGRRQALELGFTEGHLRHRLAAGRWQRVHPGVYATFTGRVERDARLWAAVCLAGRGAMLSHESAAEVQGLLDKPAGFTIHITVPSKRRAVDGKPAKGVVIHRSGQSEPEFPSGSWKIPRTRVEDTVLDLVASAPTFERGYAWVARAVSRHLTTVAMLCAALAGRSRYRWRAWLADALQDSGEGIDSCLERRYVRDVEQAHGLPAATRQASRTINGRTHRRDNWYAEHRVIVEIDGPAYHQGDRAEADKDRDNLNLAADAAQTFRFGPVALTEHACQSAALVAAALRRNGWPARPHPCPRPNCPIPPPPR